MCEIYVASVAVLCVAANILLPDAFVLIDPTPALTNRCSYAKSVIPIATVPPTGRYPDPNDNVRVVLMEILIGYKLLIQYQQR